MTSAKKTKKRNEERIKQLKQELLEQQTEIFEARRWVHTQRHVYSVLKTTSEMDVDHFQVALVRHDTSQLSHESLTCGTQKNLNEQSLVKLQECLKAVEKTIIKLAKMPELEEDTNLPEIHSVSEQIMCAARTTRANETMDGFFDFERDPDDVESEYKAAIASLIDEED